MTSPSDLARKCVVQGFIPDYMEQSAAKAFAKAYATKGDIEVERKISNRMARSPIHSMAILKAILTELPDKPRKEEPAKDAPAVDAHKTIEEEWDMEERDRTEHIELEKRMAETFGWEPRPLTEPDDPRFDQKPSIFDGPYRDHEEYKKHTFASVYRESRETNVTMHEICRRLGLRYDALLK